jgi:threonine dehydrogenase-like Zn-dependent dehydrogenase
MVADGVVGAEHGWFECYEIQRPVPMDIPVEAALPMCTWREVYGGFGDFQLKPGADILVFGAGPAGLSFVKLARLLGLGYIGVVDPLEIKRRRALQMGADEAFEPGSVKARAALSLIGMGGSICIYGVLAEPSITIHKHQAPYNFNLFVHQWPTRSRERAAMEPLCDWVRQGKLRAADFTTHEFPIDRIAEAIEAVRGGEALKVLLRY